MADPVPGPRYQLELDSTQAHLVYRALDFWDRVHGGQFDELLDCAAPGVDRGLARTEIESFKRVMRPDLGSGASNFNFPGGRLAFNLRKAIEYAVSWYEHPPTSESQHLTPYQGPLDGWWEGTLPVVVTVLEPEPISKKGKAIHAP